MSTVKQQLTIFTPAYNRAYSLHLCYKSLVKQRNKNFIWLVIDDGSTDNTKDLIDQWRKENNGFEIRYIYKENGGMHTAHNTAYDNIETELNICIDSDDYMTDNAVEIILDCWKKYGKEQYSGIIGLNINSENKIIGTKLPKECLDIKLRDFYKNGGKGDKKLVYRTSVMKKCPDYPVFEGEKYVSLAYKYDLADDEYSLIILNEPLCVVEYQEDGSSMNMFNQYLKNPQGFAFIRKHSMARSQDKKDIFRNCIHYVSSSIISKNKNFIKESPQKPLTILAIPFGIVLTLYIKEKSHGFMRIEGRK